MGTGWTAVPARPSMDPGQGQPHAGEECMSGKGEADSVEHATSSDLHRRQLLRRLFLPCTGQTTTSHFAELVEHGANNVAVNIIILSETEASCAVFLSSFYPSSRLVGCGGSTSSF